MFSILFGSNKAAIETSNQAEVVTDPKIVAEARERLVENFVKALEALPSHSKIVESRAMMTELAGLFNQVPEKEIVLKIRNKSDNCGFRLEPRIHVGIEGVSFVYRACGDQGVYDIQTNDARDFLGRCNQHNFSFNYLQEEINRNIDGAHSLLQYRLNRVSKS